MQTHSLFRSSPGNDLIDLLKSGVSVRPSVHLYFHKVFSDLDVICCVGKPRPHAQCNLDLIHGQGEGHGASEVAKIADTDVTLT